MRKSNISYFLIMNRIFIMAFAALLSATVIAQTSIPEPEFVNSYCILTSDSTYDVLPKENGSIGKHENKTKGIMSKISKAAGAASKVGLFGAAIGLNSGNISGAMTGLNAARTAASTASMASSVSALAGSSGMDVIFQGKSSSYTYEWNGEDIRLLIKGENNEQDPMGIYRIVRFNTTKKDRRIQWMEFEPSFLGSDETKSGGYVYFTGHKYGEQSYLLTLPATEIEAGQYGIFFMSVISASAIPVGTFCVK